jgi:phosphatidylethanolamine-binding protein (PEBP) family uncharacterized protein
MQQVASLESHCAVGIRRPINFPPPCEQTMRKASLMVVTILSSLAGPWAASALTLTSPDIKLCAKISDGQVFDGLGSSGRNISPALNWSEAPGGQELRG